MGSVAPSSLRSRHSRSSRGSLSNKNTMKGRTTVLGSFLSSQVTGKGCKALRQLQPAVYDRVKSSTIMADYCLQLERHLSLDDLQGCKSLLQGIAPRIYEHTDFHGQGNEENREGFILCGGDVLLMKILCSSLSDDGGRSPRSADAIKDLLAIRNDCMSMLRELCYSTPFFSYSLCVHDDFIITLFTMMQRPETFVYGVGLAEEILAVREETLSLKSIPDFTKLVTSLSARQLSLFCRVLAMVVFEPEERIPEGLSVGKDGTLLVRMDDSQGAAVADMNHDTLLETPDFLHRLVKLLHVKRQVAQNQAQIPLDQIFARLHAIGLDGGEMQPLLGMAHLADQEDWEELEASIQEAVRGENEVAEPELGVEADLAVGVPRQETLEDEAMNGAGTRQGGGWGAFFGGRLWGTGNTSRQQTSHGTGDNLAQVQNESDNAGQAPATGPAVGHMPLAVPEVDQTEGTMATVIMLDSQNEDMVSPDEWLPVANHLLELGGTLPRVVVHEVAGGHEPTANEDAALTTTRRELAQGLAAVLGNGVSMMGDDVSDPFQSLSYVSHKVEVLFVLCALCGGKRKEQVQDRLAALGLVPALAEMFDRLDWQLPQPPPPEPHGIHGPGCACNPQSALKIQYLRLLHNFCDRDGSNRANKDLLIQPVARQASSPEPGEGSGSSSNPHEKIDGPSSRKEGEGLMEKVLHLLMDEPCDSVYRFWLASCVEAFLRGSDPRDQEYVVSTGLMEHLLAEILKGGFKCAPTLQINFDLLGELIKFNPSLFARFNNLLRGKQFDRLVEVIVTHLVDSNVFIRAVILSLEAFRTARVGPLAQLQASSRPDTDVLGYDWRPSTQTSSENARLQPCEEPSTSGCAGYMSSFHDAAAFDTDGCKITAFLACNALRLLRDLMCAVRPGDINQDNICVLNTALIFFILAERNGHLSTYLQALRSADMGGAGGGTGSVARNFRTLLDFWRDYYARRRGRDRASLEYSTTIPFPEWERMVGLLCSGPESPMSLLYSPAANQCATLSASTEPPRRRC